MSERSYLSIGDVLGLLREEFPDITISKIRFLESRGLLVPERTPSGYRKFYDHDVERLRWILRQQREHFLPLKVIKGRLEGVEPASHPKSLFDPAEPPPAELVTPARSDLSARQASNGITHPSTGGLTGDLAVSSARIATMQRGAEAPAGAELAVLRGSASGRAQSGDPAAARHHLSGLGDGGVSAGSPAPSAAGPDPGSGSEHGSDLSPDPGPAPVGSEPPAGQRSGTPHEHPHAGRATPGAGPEAEAETPPSPKETAPVAQARPAPATEGAGSAGAAPAAEPGKAAPPAASSAGPGRQGERPLAGRGKVLPGANLTAGELAQTSGLTLAQVEELESFGLIEGRTVAGVHCYDEEAVLVAGLASSFTRFGIEARHLKIFKHAAERQAGLYAQVVMPLLRQRNPEARARAQADLQRLAELGTSIQTCFTRASLRDLTGG
ncbi:MAG: MerR family transcriptional regulator [Acidimicrobiales bacterium]